MAGKYGNDDEEKKILLRASSMLGNARALRIYRAENYEKIRSARAALDELPDLRVVELGSGTQSGVFVARGPAPIKRGDMTVDGGAGASNSSEADDEVVEGARGGAREEFKVVTKIVDVDNDSDDD